MSNVKKTIGQQHRESFEYNENHKIIDFSSEDASLPGIINSPKESHENCKSLLQRSCCKIKRILSSKYSLAIYSAIFSLIVFALLLHSQESASESIAFYKFAIFLFYILFQYIIVNAALFLF